MKRRVEGGEGRWWETNRPSRVAQEMRAGCYLEIPVFREKILLNHDFAFTSCDSGDTCGEVRIEVSFPTVNILRSRLLDLGFGADGTRVSRSEAMVPIAVDDPDESLRSARGGEGRRRGIGLGDVGA